MRVLAIETSCDETAAAVVQGRADVLSSIVFSQVDLHRPYGGVVPEIASRSHTESLPVVIEQAVAAAGIGWDAIDCVAATYGPGLASSLVVGLGAGKALALRLGRPFMAVNHIEAHVYSVFLSGDAPRLEAVCPFTALVVSGGHTALVRVDGLGRYRLLGQTMDDAAGEAFDKGANLLGLGYPGGPAIDRESQGGDPRYVAFPRGRTDRLRGMLGDLDADLCFSFSGLKSALMYYLRDRPAPGDAERRSLAASYQEAIVDALVARCRLAVRGVKHFAVGGGVSLNSRLREKLSAMCQREGVNLLLAEPRFCGDNAAMIAGLACAGSALVGDAAMRADAEPNAGIGAGATVSMERVKGIEPS